jgi:hypothetical protein
MSERREIRFGLREVLILVFALVVNAVIVAILAQNFLTLD